MKTYQSSGRSPALMLAWIQPFGNKTAPATPWRRKVLKPLACICSALNIALLLLVSPYLHSAPIAVWKSIPATMNQYSVCLPTLAGGKDAGTPLDSLLIEYQFNSSGWNTLVSTNSPNNSNAYAPGDFLTGNTYMPISGTLYLRGTVTDVNGSSTAYANITINSSPASGLPSLLCARVETYNYGCAWMNDGTTQRCWWTAGYGAGGITAGDVIVYADGSSQPPGSTTPVDVVTSTSFGGNRLMSNPSVIKYPITYNSHTYSYVMYLTEAQTGGGLNDISIAFSDDPDTGWTQPVLDPSYSPSLRVGVVSEDSSGVPGHFGAGIPSVLRIRDGSGNTVKWVMFNTDTDASNNQVIYYRESTDGIHWPFGSGNITTVTQTDAGTSNPILYLDNTQADGSNPTFTNYSGYWYMVFSTTSHGVKIYSKPDNVALSSGSWTYLKEVPSTIAMPTKHNAGFFRDTDGYSFSGAIVVSFANDDNDIYGSQLYYYY